MSRLIKRAVDDFIITGDPEEDYVSRNIGESKKRGEHANSTRPAGESYPGPSCYEATALFTDCPVNRPLQNVI